MLTVTVAPTCASPVARNSRACRYAGRLALAKCPLTGFDTFRSGSSLNANWTAVYPSRSFVLTCDTRQGPASITDRKSTRLKLQSPCNLVCRLLLEKKKTKPNQNGKVAEISTYTISQ